MPIIPLIGTHGEVKPEKKSEGSTGSPYKYGSPMVIVPEGQAQTMKAYDSTKIYGNEIKLIIAGSQGTTGSQHLIKTAEMVGSIYDKVPNIIEHPGAILPSLDLQEVFGQKFIRMVEEHVEKEYGEQDAGIKQKITFKFLQVLFEGKTEKGVLIKINNKMVKLFLPQNIIEESAPGKILSARQEADTKNAKNIKEIVQIITNTQGKILVIASKEQVRHIGQGLGVSVGNIPEPENNKVYIVNSGTVTQISE